MKAQMDSLPISKINKMMEVNSAEKELLLFSGRNIYDRVYARAVRVEGLTISLCTGGRAAVQIQEKECNMSAGSLCIQTPGTPVGWSGLSEDYDGYEFIVSMDYIKKLPFDLKNLTTAFALLKHEPFFTLNEKQQEDFIRLFGLMESTAETLDYYRSQSLEGFVVSLLYYVCDVIHQRQEDFEKVMNVYQGRDRKHYYFLNFLELLGKYSHQERGITFYADKMFLTPKYLSTVIKEVSGRSAGEWIDEYVMLEAKALLQHAEANISETAYQLNFPNASFFGRYFKKHTGMSPGDYKRTLAFQ